MKYFNLARSLDALKLERYFRSRLYRWDQTPGEMIQWIDKILHQLCKLGLQLLCPSGRIPRIYILYIFLHPLGLPTRSWRKKKLWQGIEQHCPKPMTQRSNCFNHPTGSKDQTLWVTHGFQQNWGSCVFFSRFKSLVSVGDFRWNLGVTGWQDHSLDLRLTGGAFNWGCTFQFPWLVEYGCFQK